MKKSMKIEDGILIKCGDIAGDVTVPHGVRAVGDNAFYQCGSIESITIPETVTSIGNCAFKYCDHAESIILPEKTDRMGAEVFEYCWKLREVVLPKGVRSIGETMFEGCSSLERIVIPDSVEHISRRAFSSCKRLRSIEINMKKLDILPYSMRNYAVMGCITAHTYDREEDAGEQQLAVNEYIRKHNRSFFDIVLSSDSKAGVNYIISNDLLDPALIDTFLALSSRQKRGEITAMLLSYKERLGLTGIEKEEEWDPFL